MLELPALAGFHREVEPEMLAFRRLLREIRDLSLNDEALGFLDPLLVEHQFREECYYLIKLSQTGQVRRPDCDPAAPSVGR